VLSLAVTYGVTSPLFFHVSASPFAGAQSRGGGGGTVAANGAHRIDFWRDAVHGFLSNPFDGTGYGRLLTALPASGTTATSPLAHNGFLQALAEGGLLLAVPLAVALLGCAALLVLALRHPTQWGAVPFAAAVAGLGLLVHGLVDFDWTFPANVGAFALCVAVAAAPRWHARESTRLRRVAACLLVALSLAAGVLAVGQSFEVVHIDARTQPGATS
jgi:O-antigen ligase